MDKKLSQEEIDALLSSVGGAERTAGSGDPQEIARASGKRFMVYDFRRTDRVPKATLQSLQLVHDRFCVNTAASLSAYLRVLTEMSIVSVKQSSFGEFLLGLPDPTFLSAISMRPLHGMAALEISLDLIFPLIDRLLGAASHTPDATRKTTDIEKNVIQGVIKVITGNLIEAWRPVTEVNFHFQSSETRPQLFQIGSPNEAVLTFEFELKVGGTRGTMHLCLLCSSLEPISGKFEQESTVERAVSAEDSTRVLLSLLRTPFTLTSELPPTLVSVKDLLGIASGDIIRLDTKAEDPIQLYIGGTLAFEAEALEMDGHKAAGVIRRV